MTGFMIGELARRAGVAASALRYYKKVGLLPLPARASGHGL
jgi:DNA-binding transcriptional MerR regulator